MRLFLTAIFSIFLISAYSQCAPLSLKVALEESANFSATNQEYLVNIEILTEDAVACDDSGNFPFKVFSSCGELENHIATQTSTVPVYTADGSCFLPSQYTSSGLVRKNYQGLINIGNFSCAEVIVYCERGGKAFRNIANSDSLKVPVVGWVKIRTQHWPNQQVKMNLETEVIQACLGQKKFIQPITSDPDGDSVYTRPVHLKHYDFTGGQPQFATRAFAPGLSSNYPLRASNFSRLPRWKGVTFSPADTGLMVLPMEISEMKTDSIFPLWFDYITTYWQVPVYVSDSCHRALSSDNPFATDTVNHSCGSPLLIPFSSAVANSHLSADGSNFKFHQPQGFPSVISGASAQAAPPYTDTVAIDVQFFEDGLYEIRLVQGTGSQSLLNECGSLVSSLHKLYVQVSGCASSSLREEAFEVPAVFPNPFTGLLRIEGHRPIVKLVLLGADGNVILTKENQRPAENLELDFDRLSTGIYFLELEFISGELFRQKLLKTGE